MASPLQYRNYILWLLSIALIIATIISFFAAYRPQPMSSVDSGKVKENKASLQKFRSYQFPEGGSTLFPEYRLVALYGTPDYPALGALGEQPLAQTVSRIKELSNHYSTLGKEKVYPSFEIIASVASAGPTENGDFSHELSISQLKPWVDEAKRQGIYVILDLQPGRTDFLTQAKTYESLLREPHVGLALDPEWRLKPHEFHLEQIGSVGVDEVNATSRWLADMVKQAKLPQKLFLIHQFRLSMIEGRERLDTSRKELAYMIQMDGQGPFTTKQDTWNVVTAHSPPNVYFGWKNFYDEDIPMLTPEETMKITPPPYYISYQ